ncbi:Rossmann-like and DUF2520 domain-containing protein [uncultured Legionella sp.]|uniref:Rossmann-like and DUF2520 domain-containing protein n=1 Tax=uncultured Legionella sp. TaxID=210934 RepID=UPI0026354B93|nr:Rossmann-like and DUF2520 domain-containing protein [uncultured Legionella sp.]
MKCNIIGAGRLGKNIAKALSSAHLITIDSICNRSLNSAAEAIQELGMGTAVNSLIELPKVDVTWICSNDDEIAPIVSILATNSVLKPDSLVIHCSGTLNSTVLSPLKEQGCSIASFHPLKAFKKDYVDAHAFDLVHCVMEGDERAVIWVSALFERLGSKIISIRPQEKALYHAAATIASNYLITLAHISEELLLQAGIKSEQARAMINNLMQGNINNLAESAQIDDALTGPLARGDVQTLSQHLQAIKNPAIKELYKKAGLVTLEMTTLTEETEKEIKAILGD